MDILLKEQGFWDLHWGPQVGNLALERWVLRTSGFMRVWLYVHQQGLHTGEPKDYRKQEILPLKNVPQILDSPRPDSETVIWKELGSAALLILGSLPERQKQRGLLLGMEKLAAAIHRSLSAAKTRVMMRAIWSSPSSLRGLEICPPATGLKATPGQPRPQREPH